MAFLSILLSWPQVGSAQQAGRDPAKNYTNKSVFHLPLSLKPAHRQSLKELTLYVKSENGPWTAKESMPPTETSFTYRVPQDGEFWFSVVMTDLQGNRYPADVSQLAPGKKVVVDTRPPLIEALPEAGPEPLLKCVVHDAHPDPASLRVVYQGEGGRLKTVEPMPNRPGVFSLRGLETLTSPVQVLAKDLCGNEGSIIVDLHELFASATGAKSDQPPRPIVGAIPVQEPAEPSLPPGKMPPLSDTPLTQVSAKDLPVPPGSAEGVPPLPAPPDVGEEVIVPARQRQAIGAASVADSAPLPAPSQQPAAVDNQAVPLQRPLLGSPQASIEYRIDQVGPSGVGKVDVFLTRDQGATWQRLKEDADRRTPVDVELPGEGLFGIRLAITNGNGFGGTAPRPGDKADFLIEVDATCPFIQLQPIHPNVSGGHLDIAWTARDKNLGGTPISLFYRTAGDGPWQPIARDLKNDGHFSWDFPRSAGGQFFLMVEVTDQAGNSARAETPNPVLLDLTEPRGLVLGVTGQTSR